MTPVNRASTWNHLEVIFFTELCHIYIEQLHFIENRKNAQYKVNFF